MGREGEGEEGKLARQTINRAKSQQKIPTFNHKSKIPFVKSSILNLKI